MPFLMGVWGVAKKISVEVYIVLAMVLAAVAGVYITDRNAVKRTREKQKSENLETVIELQEESKEIINEIETRVEHADEAVARLPQLRSRDELRKHDPDLAALILDDPDGHQR